MSTYDFIAKGSGGGAGFIYKSPTAAYAFNGTTFLPVTSANYPATTVRGIVYLDGTYYVMTPDAKIYGSNIDDMLTWSALNVIQALSEPDPGVCLARQLNLIIAFGQYSTEFFYDAANPTGSPLLPYSSAYLEIGCACAESVSTVDNNTIFMSQGRQKGRSIQMLTGTVPSPLSTPFVDRILQQDTLVGVYSCYVKLAGHGFYILQLPSSSITLVCDLSTGLWSKWTTITAYTSPTAYTEVPFSISGYTTNGYLDLVQDSSTGSIYALDLAIYTDNNLPIRYSIRTQPFDGGLNHKKFFQRMELIGDKVAGTAYVSYSDNDYTSYSTPRGVDLNMNRSQLLRLGASRRRSFVIDNFDNVPLRLKELEITIDKGAM